jgi:hypothetical protein
VINGTISGRQKNQHGAALFPGMDSVPLVIRFSEPVMRNLRFAIIPIKNIYTLSEF